MIIFSVIATQEPNEVLCEGSGGFGEEPGVGELEKTNKHSMSHCSSSGSVTHLSAYYIRKPDRKLMWYLEIPYRKWST